MKTAKKRGDVKGRPLEIDERARLKEWEEENRRLKMEREILKKAAAWLRRRACGFAFIRDLDGEERSKPRKVRIPVSLMCEVLDVSRSGFYAWLKRNGSDREKEDAELTEVTTKIDQDHRAVWVSIGSLLNWPSWAGGPRPSVSAASAAALA